MTNGNSRRIVKIYSVQFHLVNFTFPAIQISDRVKLNYEFRDSG